MAYFLVDEKLEAWLNHAKAKSLKHRQREDTLHNISAQTLTCQSFFQRLQCWGHVLSCYV